MATDPEVSRSRVNTKLFANIPFGHNPEYPGNPIAPSNPTMGTAEPALPALPALPAEPALPALPAEPALPAAAAMGPHPLIVVPPEVALDVEVQSGTPAVRNACAQGSAIGPSRPGNRSLSQWLTRMPGSMRSSSTAASRASASRPSMTSA